MDMLESLEKLAVFIGNTPLKELELRSAAIYAKLEYNNFSGSSKDRAAYSMIYHGIKEKLINRDTIIIASSSGNLAIAIASICKILKIRFIPVIDPNINKSYECLLKLLSYDVVKVTTRDHTGGYLLTRIDKVSEMCSELKNVFCADQYCDINNYKGYFSLGGEILSAVGNVDMIFVAVSSGGAITGISRSVKEKKPDVKIVAVDVEGSVIFGRPPGIRYISGIGSSQVPPILKNAIIDDIVYVSQPDILKGCRELLEEQTIFGGASSGAVYFAAKNYGDRIETLNGSNVVLIFPDKGFAYMDTIYNEKWAGELLSKLSQPA